MYINIIIYIHQGLELIGWSIIEIYSELERLLFRVEIELKLLSHKNILDETFQLRINFDYAPAEFSKNMALIVTPRD